LKNPGRKWPTKKGRGRSPLLGREGSSKRENGGPTLRGSLGKRKPELQKRGENGRGDRKGGIFVARSIQAERGTAGKKEENWMGRVKSW